MLGGAAQVLRSEGCALVGGHTAEGAEESFGLACNGVVHPDRVLNKGPVKPGLSLILTKPLGTGTILAADMKGLAHSAWVQHAIESMLLSNRAAAECLYRFGCRACTDVTGFGVFGHLIEMMQFEDERDRKPAADGSALRARIFLSRVPTLFGATECIEKGVFSTLHPQVRFLQKSLVDFY
jgi:selenide,water dikinase